MTSYELQKAIEVTAKIVNESQYRVLTEKAIEHLTKLLDAQLLEIKEERT